MTETPVTIDQKLQSIMNPGARYNFIQRYMTLLPEMNDKQRSLMIKVCQAQYMPNPDIPCTLLLLFQKQPGIFQVDRDLRYRVYPLLEDVSFLTSYVESPLFAGIILDLTRNYRLNSKLRAQMEKNSLDKEIRACEGLTRTRSVLNFRCFLDPAFHNEPIHHTIFPNVPANTFIYRRLVHWKESLNGTILFPRTSHKMMSRDTLRELEKETGQGWDIPTQGIFSQKFWERLNYKTGIKLGGICEMRQRWTPAVVKPRTYYCQGGQAYRYSRFLQDPFTQLVNCMPTTNHITRLNPERLLVSSMSWLRIYDFTGFTSNMEEQKFFIEALAEFAEGTTVYCMDGWEGVLEFDLGDLLRMYNEECNFLSRVSYERFANDDGMISSHGTASMLGIFGNLMSCTFLHGAFEMQLVEDFQNVNIAGDDGQVPVDESSEDVFDQAQELIGQYERTKMFRSTEPGAIALKRPIFQIRETIRTLPVISCITLPTLQYTLFGRQDPRFMYFDHDLITRDIRLGMLGTDLLRFQRAVWWMSPTLSEEEQEWVIEYMLEVSRFAGHPIPNLPQCSGGGFSWPVIPNNWTEFILRLPEEELILSCYKGVVRLPVRQGGLKVMQEDLFAGSQFRSTSSRMLSWLETLGLVEKSACQEVIFGEEGRLALHKEFDFPDPCVYDYVVLEDISSKFFL